MQLVGISLIFLSSFIILSHAIPLGAFKRVVMGTRDSGAVSASFEILLDLGHAKMLQYYTLQEIAQLEENAKEYFNKFFGLDFTSTVPIPLSPNISLPGFPKEGIFFAPYASPEDSWKVAFDSLNDVRGDGKWGIREFGVILYAWKNGVFGSGIYAGVPYDADSAIGFVQLNFLKRGTYNYSDPECNCREILTCRGTAPSNPINNSFGLDDRIIKLNCNDEKGNYANGLMLNVLLPVNGDMNNITEINRNVWTWPCENGADLCGVDDSNTEFCIASAYNAINAQTNSIIYNVTLHISSANGYDVTLEPNSDGIIYVPSNLKDVVHTIVFSAPGYYSLTQTVRIARNCRKIISPYTVFLVEPILAAAVLSWENPIIKDLDIHVFFENEFPSNSHVYKGKISSKSPFPSEITLDQNVDTGFGPETLTFSNVHRNLKYLVAVNNFDESANLSSSNAKVVLYSNNGLQTTVTAPTTGEIELLWWVVAVFENQAWEVINTLVSTDLPYNSVTFDTFYNS